MLKKLVSLVWEEEAGAEVVKKEAAPPTPPPSPTTTTSTTMSGDLSDVVKESLYAKYMKGVDDIAPLIEDERTRFLATFRSSRDALSLSKAALLASAKEQADIVLGRGPHVLKDMASEVDAKSSAMEAELSKLAEEVAKKQEVIAQLVAELNALKAQRSEAEEKLVAHKKDSAERLEKTKLSFDALLTRINDDMRKMGAYLEDGV
jgi:uncharacterized phage infection (PIP) family protein YhgE